MIPAPKDIIDLVKYNIARTLAADRYLDLPKLEDKSEDAGWRARSCKGICDGKTNPGAKLPMWLEPNGFLAVLKLLGRPLKLVRATQSSRLLVNLGGTALENGGMSLDRISGLPTIPGSAVKGIARREALLTLKSAVTEERASWLANIAEDFGWGPNDWGETSDFAQACDAAWPVTKVTAREILATSFDCPAEKLPASYSGRVCFLPAFPESEPVIVSEILTCHHPLYYAGTKEVAFDDEDPRPIVFPAVEKGATWIFPLLGTNAEATDHCDEAARFLAAGLRQGIGAKIAAGYSRFSPLGDYTATPSAIPSDSFSFTFVTPCMCAGADQRIAELRVSSLRGELRWWFRALGGTKEQEADVFGGVSGEAVSSALLLELAEFKNPKTPWIAEECYDRNGKRIRFLQHISDASYLWHFAAVSGAGDDKLRLWDGRGKEAKPNHAAALAPGTTFTLRRTWRRQVPTDCHVLFDRAWNAFLCFGAIGLRANRAMGCWMPMATNLDHNAVIADLRRSGFRVIVSDRHFPEWKDAVGYIGAWMKHTIRKQHPVGKGKNQNPSPLGAASPRNSSAVRFRILKVDEVKFQPMAFEAPHNRVLPLPARKPTAVLDIPGLFMGPAPQGKGRPRGW